MNSGFVVQTRPAPANRYLGIASGEAWPLARLTDPAARKLTAQVESGFGTLADGRFALWLAGHSLALDYYRECVRRALPIRLLYVQSAVSGHAIAPPPPGCDFLGFDYVSPDLTYSFVEDEVAGQAAAAALATTLNQAGLFDSMSHVGAFLSSRANVPDLESIPSADVVAVYECTVPKGGP